MNIYIFANDKELVSSPIVASGKVEAKKKLSELIEKSSKVIENNIDKLKEEIKSCSNAIEDYKEDMAKGNIKEEDISGFDYIDFQKGLIKEDEVKIKEQEVKLKALPVVSELSCFVISKKA